MVGTIIDMSKIKQLLQLKKAGISNRQIAKSLKLSRDKVYILTILTPTDTLLSGGQLG